MGKARAKTKVKGGAAPKAVVLDSRALIAFEWGNARMRALVRQVLQTSDVIDATVALTARRARCHRHEPRR